MNSKMNKIIFLISVLLINSFNIFGNNIQNNNQDFIEAIKKTYSNHEFPLIHAHNTFLTLYKEYHPLMSLTSKLKTAEDTTSIQSLQKNNPIFSEKYLENLRNALSTIEKSTDFYYELYQKKTSDKNKEKLEADNKNMKNLELMKKSMFVLTGFYIFNVLLTLRKDHRFDIFGFFGQFIFRPSYS